MKQLMTLIATLSFVFSVSLSVQAAGASGATQAGPLVTCLYEDGSTDYVPTMICTNESGTFLRN